MSLSCLLILILPSERKTLGIKQIMFSNLFVLFSLQEFWALRVESVIQCAM